MDTNEKTVYVNNESDNVKTEIEEVVSKRLFEESFDDLLETMRTQSKISEIQDTNIKNLFEMNYKINNNVDYLFKKIKKTNRVLLFTSIGTTLSLIISIVIIIYLKGIFL